LALSELDLASRYFETRLRAAREATQLSPTEQLDLARMPVDDDALEEIVNQFRDSPRPADGWGLAPVLQEVLSREPKRIPVSDLTALQNNLKAGGYLPPDYPTGTWDPTSYAAFRRFDRDNFEEQRAGNHWYSAPIMSGAKALANTLPSRVFQGIVGAAKGFVTQAPETAERVGLLGGAAAGAGIGGLIGGPAGAGVGAIIGGGIGFFADLFGEDEGEEDQSWLGKVGDALSPWEEYRDNPKAAWEDLGWVLTAASLTSGAGTIARGITGISKAGTVTGGLAGLRMARALPQAGAVTEPIMAAGKPTLQAVAGGGFRMLPTQVQIGTQVVKQAPLLRAALVPRVDLGLAGKAELGFFGTLYRESTRLKNILPGTPAKVIANMEKFSPIAFVNRVGPRIGLDVFGGLSQAQMGARLFGGIGQGSKTRFLEAKKALEAEFGRDLTVEEEDELSKRTATSTIERAIAEAPLGELGIGIPLLGDVVDLAAFLLYPTKLLPFSSVRAAQTMQKMLDADYLKLAYAHVIQEGQPIGVRAALNQADEIIPPEVHTWLMHEFGVFAEANSLMSVTYKNLGLEAFLSNAEEVAKADIRRVILGEFDKVGKSETLERVMMYAQANPTAFEGWLRDLNTQRRGVDRIKSYLEANAIIRRLNNEIDNTETLIARYSPDGRPEIVYAYDTSRVRTTPGVPRTSIAGVEARISELDALIVKTERIAANAPNPTATYNNRAQVQLYEAEREALQKTLAQLKGQATKEFRKGVRIAAARLDFQDRGTIFAKRAQFDALRDAVKNAPDGDAKVFARQKLANYVDDELVAPGLVGEELKLTALSENPSDAISRHLEKVGGAAAAKFDLPPQYEQELAELGYKAVETGQDVIFPDELIRMTEVQGLSDYSRRASFWETIGGSLLKRLDVDLAGLRSVAIRSEITQVIEGKLAVTADTVMARIYRELKAINHNGAVIGPLGVKAGGKRKLEAYKVAITDLSKDEVFDALEGITGMTPEIAFDIFGALRRGSAFGGEVSLLHPIDSAHVIGRAIRLNGLPGFADAIRTLHAKGFETRLDRAAWRQDAFRWTPDLEMARSPHRKVVEVHLQEVAERAQLTQGQREIAQALLDVNARAQVKAGRFASIDDFYKHIDVGYADRYVSQGSRDEALLKIRQMTDGVEHDLARAGLEEALVEGLTEYGPDFVTIMRFFRDADFGTLVREQAHLLLRLLPDEDVRILEQAYGILPPEPISFVPTPIKVGKNFDAAGPEILTRTNAANGATWDPHTGRFVEGGQPKAGLAVGTEVTTRIISPTEAAFRDPAEFTRELKRFAREHREALANPRNHIGTRKDADGIHIDISTIVPTRAEAQRIGARAKQKAAFDLEKLEDVPIIEGVTWPREAEERFARDLERYIMKKLRPGYARGTFEVLGEALGGLWGAMRPAAVETNIVPRPVRQIMDKYFGAAYKIRPETRTLTTIRDIKSRQVVAGAAVGGVAGAIEGDEPSDILEGALRGAAVGLVGRKALRRTYGYLPDALARMNTALRYTFSLTFDAGRYTEQNFLAMLRNNLPPMWSPVKHVKSRSWERSPFRAGAVTGDAAWQDAVRLHDTIHGTSYVSIDDFDRRMFQAGMLGFSPRNWEIAQTWQLWQRGMPAEEIKEAVALIGRYGTGRTALEKSANFVVFPFSFSKKLITSLGDFVLQAPARNLLLTEGLRRYVESEYDDQIKEFLDKHVPLLEELKSINNLAFGLSPGRFFLQGIDDHRTGVGKAAQLLASFFVPSGAATSLAEAAGNAADLAINAFVPIVLTDESVNRAGGVENMFDVFRRYVPFIRELDQYFIGTGDNPSAISRQYTALRQGADPFYQFANYQDELRRLKEPFVPLALAMGYSSVDGLLSSDLGSLLATDLEEREAQLADQYPSGFQMSQEFTNKDRINEQALLELAKWPSRSAGEDAILEAAQQAEYLKIIMPQLGFDSTITNALIASSMRSLAKRHAGDRRFAELWDRFFLRDYGPIRRVA
jgi:hypothetical protein